MILPFFSQMLWSPYVSYALRYSLLRTSYLNYSCSFCPVITSFWSCIWSALIYIHRSIPFGVIVLLTCAFLLLRTFPSGYHPCVPPLLFPSMHPLLHWLHTSFPFYFVRVISACPTSWQILDCSCALLNLANTAFKSNPCWLCNTIFVCLQVLLLFSKD